MDWGEKRRILALDDLGVVLKVIPKALLGLGLSLFAMVLYPGQSAIASPAEGGFSEVFDLQFFGDTYIPAASHLRIRSADSDLNILNETSSLIFSSRANLVNFEAVATNAFFSQGWKQHLLRSPESAPLFLKNSGITGITLANNHAMDFGFQGLFDTIFLAEKSGLLVAGAGESEEAALKPMIVSSKNATYCIVAVSRTFPMSFWATPHRPGSATVSISDAAKLSGKCQGTNHDTIASIHWGRELSPEAQDYQRVLARALIDGGAIAVIGHHPHVLQEIEVYKGRPIFYSIGNYAFGSLTGPGRQEGAAVALLKEGSGKFKYRVTPINVDNTVVRFTPRLFRSDENDPLTPIITKVKGCQLLAAPTKSFPKSYLCSFD